MPIRAARRSVVVLVRLRLVVLRTGGIDVRLDQSFGVMPLPFGELALLSIAQRGLPRRCAGRARSGRPAAGERRHNGEAIDAQGDVNVRVAATLDTWASGQPGRCLARRSTSSPVHDDLELVVRGQRMTEGDKEVGPSE